MSIAAITTNLTPFVAGHFLLPDGDGGERVVVIVKATLDVDPHGNMIIAEDGVPLRLADEFRGDPKLGSPLHDNDLVPWKPRVDVVVEALGYGPIVELHVGTIHKQIRVSGDRIWIDDQPSAPEPFTAMPLIWERAYGGDERNPVGIGRPQLPNLEDPDAPMLHPDSVCAPVGLGVVSRAWLPRRTLAGSFDSAWKRERWPLAPRDFDPGFHQSAPDDQQLESYDGGERVRLVNMTAQGEWSFRLPQLDVPIHFLFPDRHIHAPLRVDTVEIDAERQRVLLTGRAAIPIERRRPGLTEIILGHAKPALLKAKRTGKCHLDLRNDRNARGIDTSRAYLR